MVHKNPEQVRRLLCAISDPGNSYLVHVDKKVGRAELRAFREATRGVAGVTFMRRRRVVWGGFSVVAVELEALRRAVSNLPDWDFIINLSGQDFPLKTQDAIREELGRHRGCNFLEVDDYSERAYWRDRLRFRAFETKRFIKLSDKPLRRKLPECFVPHCGSQWYILSRSFCEYLLRSPAYWQLRRFYAHTAVPDEAFFQTAIMNSSYRCSVCPDNKRLIVWDEPPGGHPHVLTMDHWPLVEESDAFLARKFDVHVDGEIIERLEERLGVST